MIPYPNEARLQCPSATDHGAALGALQPLATLHTGAGHQCPLGCPGVKLGGSSLDFMGFHGIIIGYMMVYPLVNKHSYGKWPLIVDFPIKNCDFP